MTTDQTPKTRLGEWLDEHESELCYVGCCDQGDVAHRSFAGLRAFDEGHPTMHATEMHINAYEDDDGHHDAYIQIFGPQIADNETVLYCQTCSKPYPCPDRVDVEKAVGGCE